MKNNHLATVEQLHALFLYDAAAENIAGQHDRRVLWSFLEKQMADEQQWVGMAQQPGT